VALVRLSSRVTKLKLGASQIIWVEGISTGGGVAMCTGDEGMMVVTRGEDILSLSVSAARTALRYAPRSPTDLYSSMKELMMFLGTRERNGEERNGSFAIDSLLLLCAFGHSFLVRVSAIEVSD